MRALAISTCWAWLVGAAAAQTCGTEQVSLGPGGAWPDANSGDAVISPDGRFVAFSTEASVFSAGLFAPQVCLADRESGTVELISAKPGGSASTYPGYAFCRPIAISSGGRFVTFESSAKDLVAGDLNISEDVFVRDRHSGQTVLVSRSASGAPSLERSLGSASSCDGRWTAFESEGALLPVDGNTLTDVYVFDRVSGAMELVSVALGGGAAGNSVAPGSPVRISADGRSVLFHSHSGALVAGDTNGERDVFVRDLASGTTVRALTGLGGSEPDGDNYLHAISADARFLLIQSTATNLVIGDTNGESDLFLLDRTLGSVSLLSLGVPASLLYVYPTDVSDDGARVLFETAIGFLPGDDTASLDVYVRDLATATTTLVSETAAGGFSFHHSHGGVFSCDARSIAFTSRAPQLTQPPVQNGRNDVFVRECAPSAPTTYCVQAPAGACLPSIGSSGIPSASAPSGFDVTSLPMPNQKNGLLFYGTNGASVAPMLGGLVCVRPPLCRTGVQSSGGSAAGNDCSGAFHFDFNARIASGLDPALVAGTQVWCQYWSRANGGATHLGNALHFVVQP